MNRRRLLAGLATFAAAAWLYPPGSASAAPNPALQAGPGETWVQNFEVTQLWSGPNSGAVSFGWLKKFSFLRVEKSELDRYYVFNPRAGDYAWVDAWVVGPSGPPPADYLEPIKTLAKFEHLPARLIGKASLYAEPTADDAVWLKTGYHNQPVTVAAKVKSEDSDTPFYRLDSGEYVADDDIRLPNAPVARYPGKWIDADLTEPTIVTAYEGNKPVASALAIHGVAAWRTPVGTFSIIRRVYNETMSSAGLGIPPDAPGGYLVKNVLFTQYFTGDGASLHYNYWSGNFGYAGSHGCLGLSYDDALWFWNWVDVGTPIVTHY